MQGNDLGNSPVPRVVLVAEGALIFMDPRDEAKFDRAMEKRRYTEALSYWTVNDLMATRIWDVALPPSLLNLDIVTFLGPEPWADALAGRLESEDLPVRSVFASTPAILGRKVTFHKEILRVYTPFPEQALMFGPKGVVITDVNQVGR